MDPTLGHEQAGRRPVLVLSQEPFNQRSGLVTVVPLTTARRPPRPWEVTLPTGCGGILTDSIVLAAHIRTLSRERLQLPPLGRITDAGIRREIAGCVLLHLGFTDLERLAFEE
ncbi:MAG: type II toxin-antitoxin system PemK/MazF family toxin [Armatimonadetes bacterium]|nr:type II toxin-antitoxin system PemK/MazF family toxin [Armatimonadota bacterium]